MSNVTQMKKNPKDRGDQRQGYGKANQDDRDPRENEEDTKQQKPPQELPDENGPGPVSRQPERAGN